MSRGSWQPDRFTGERSLAERVRVIEDRLKKGFPHGLGDHADVDLQGATSASAVVRGVGAKWRPGAAGGLSSWIALRTSLSQPAIPAGGVGSLLWRDQGIAGMIEGPAFSWSSGTPANIVVNEASFVFVDLYVALNSAQETYVAAQIGGLDWGNVEDVRAATPAYGLTPVHFSFESTVGVGDIISASAWHDDVNDDLSVAGSAICVVQLAAL